MKVLMVLAHADDELIFGWPLLQDQSIEKEILICSSDLHNPLRKRYRRRKEALARLCGFLGLRHHCFDYDSDFYKMDMRPPKKQKRRLGDIFKPDKPVTLLKDIAGRILETVEKSGCDAVFTHNLWGEYGHMDHILINSVIMNNTRKPALMTDARLQAENLPIAEAAPAWREILARHYRSTHALDLDFYEKCAAFYKDSGTWTWSSPPITRLNLYMFPPAAPN